MIAFLLWCLLFVLCWPLTLLALILYPIVWLLLLPSEWLDRCQWSARPGLGRGDAACALAQRSVSAVANLKGWGAIGVVVAPGNSQPLATQEGFRHQRAKKTERPAGLPSQSAIALNPGQLRSR